MGSVTDIFVQYILKFIPKSKNFETVAWRHVHVTFAQGGGLNMAALAGIDCDLLIMQA